jgi:hypothetical protein
VVALRHGRFLGERGFARLTHVLTAGRHSLRPGTKVEIDFGRDYPVIDAQDESELRYYIHYAEGQGLIQRPGPTSPYELSPAGWDRLNASSGHFVQGRCFVAMAFRPELETAFRDGIRPAVEDDCGLEACSDARVGA